MEKRTAHYSLAIVKKLVEEKKVRTTGSALAGAAVLGISWEEILETIMVLKPKDLYKSMTTHANHTIWQDVYKPITAKGKLYVKLTVQEDLLIVSFKEQ